MANGAQPIAGTLAARYLRRCPEALISKALLPDDISKSGSLRFHPDCPFGPGTRYPCLIALMRNPISGQPTGIHRTALTPDAQKIDRMMLGPAGVVQLWPAGRVLVIGEGLETTLAAATRLPYRGAPLRPAWAMLSDGALARFPVIAGVERLILLADNDLNNAGADRRPKRLQASLAKAGRARAVGAQPDRPGTDFNDIVLAENLERCIMSRVHCRRVRAQRSCVRRQATPRRTTPRHRMATPAAAAQGQRSAPPGTVPGAATASLAATG